MRALGATYRYCSDFGVLAHDPESIKLQLNDRQGKNTGVLRLSSE